MEEKEDKNSFWQKRKVNKEVPEEILRKVLEINLFL